MFLYFAQYRFVPVIFISGSLTQLLLGLLNRLSEFNVESITGDMSTIFHVSY